MTGSHPSKGNWNRFDSIDMKATEIIQRWKQVCNVKHISICHFSLREMKKTMKKNYCW